jgi:hypothetical protein
MFLADLYVAISFACNLLLTACELTYYLTSRSNTNWFWYKQQKKTMTVWEDKRKAIPVTGRGSPKCCEMSRLLYFLENRLTGGGEAVSFTLRPSFSTRKIPGTYFCQQLSHSMARTIRSIEKSNNLISNGTLDLPGFTIKPQLTTLRCVPMVWENNGNITVNTYVSNILPCIIHLRKYDTSQWWNGSSELTHVEITIGTSEH